MKRFEAIEERIILSEVLKSNLIPNEKQLISELKQIIDEHSEMVGMLVKVRNKLSGNGFPVLISEIDTLLTKINNK